MKISRTIVILAALAPALLALRNPADTPSTQPAQGQKYVSPSGLTIIDLSTGDGARVGDTVWVHYQGRVADGEEFDSTYDRQEPIALTLGEARVIAGLEEGLLGMHVGQKRRLIIPPSLAYGAQGKGKIPPNTTLIFNVEMMGIRRG